MLDVIITAVVLFVFGFCVIRLITSNKIESEFLCDVFILSVFMSIGLGLACLLFVSVKGFDWAAADHKATVINRPQRDFLRRGCD